MDALRVRIAAGLMLGVLSLLGAAQAHAATVRYACDARQNLTVERDGDAANVRFLRRTYKLERKASSIGLKYVAATAALIIDGRSAVFVAEDRLQFPACTEVATAAVAR